MVLKRPVVEMCTAQHQLPGSYPILTSAGHTHSLSGLARFHMEGAPHCNLQRGPGKETSEEPSWKADAQMVSFMLALAARL